VVLGRIRPISAPEDRWEMGAVTPLSAAVTGDQKPGPVPGPWFHGGPKSVRGSILSFKWW